MYELMRHKSGGVLPVDRFGFIRRNKQNEDVQVSGILLSHKRQTKGYP